MKKLYFFKKIVNNFRGFHTSRKIIVIEVDDYGTCQYEDLQALNEINNLKEELPYFYQHDRLESYNDLSKLFEVLTSVKDKNGNYAVFTPLTVVTNPCKEKILETGRYCFENFNETIQRIHGNETWQLWLEGINTGIFVPEFHGREHINVDVWMSQLSKHSKNNFVFELFNKGIFVSLNKDNSSTPPYFFSNNTEFAAKSNSLSDGLKIFKDIFGRNAVSYTPPVGAYSYAYEKVLYENGIMAVQLGYQQQIISAYNFTIEDKFHYFGQKSNTTSILYTPRNAVFEPHNPLRKDCVSHCMFKVNLAFKLRKPAIISSHRVNFIENNLSNKINGLKKLEKLLKEIVKKWPDVEFMSSKDLINLMLINHK
jgi:hypothetical protein